MKYILYRGTHAQTQAHGHQVAITLSFALSVRARFAVQVKVGWWFVAVDRIQECLIFVNERQMALCAIAEQRAVAHSAHASVPECRRR